MKMAYARKFSLHVLITAFNLLFPSAPLIWKYDTKLWCHIITYSLCCIYTTCYMLLAIRLENTKYMEKITMTLIITHCNHGERKVEKEKWILEKGIRPLGQPLQASSLDNWNVSVMSLENISLLYTGFLLYIAFLSRVRSRWHSDVWVCLISSVLLLHNIFT